MDLTTSRSENQHEKRERLFSKLMRFWIENKLFMFLVLSFTLLGGISVAPFDWNISWLPRFPVPVDAIPDIGENHQIVFTTWEGRSPKDIEDQITYPLTVALLGVPGVKVIRSDSY
ncbi:MAG: efflux RND transporter permease subunit, partial [Desulfomonilaceae bacterium]